MQDCKRKKKLCIGWAFDLYRLTKSSMDYSYCHSTSWFIASNIGWDLQELSKSNVAHSQCLRTFWFIANNGCTLLVPCYLRPSHSTTTFSDTFSNNLLQGILVFILIRVGFNPYCILEALLVRPFKIAKYKFIFPVRAPAPPPSTIPATITSSMMAITIWNVYRYTMEVFPFTLLWQNTCQMTLKKENKVYSGLGIKGIIFSGQEWHSNRQGRPIWSLRQKTIDYTVLKIRKQRTVKVKAQLLSPCIQSRTPVHGKVPHTLKVKLPTSFHIT